MLTSNQCKYQIGVKKKSIARMEKELAAARAQVKKLEAGMKAALAKEKAKPKARKR